MPGALNNFKTTLANVTATTTTVYTPPTGYSTVVLMAQVANNGVATVQISSSILRSGNSTSLVNEADLPANDAISVITGRLILNVGDQLQVKSSDNTSAQLTLSYLETLITGS